MEKGIDRDMLRELILAEAPEMRLSCQKAFDIAEKTGCSPAELGRLCDEIEVKIIGCRLGCF